MLDHRPQVALEVVEHRAETLPLVRDRIAIGPALDELGDLGNEGGNRGASIPGDLAEEEVEGLDPRGSLIDGVDLGVPDVLLQGIVLGEPGTAEHLEGVGELLVGLFRW